MGDIGRRENYLLLAIAKKDGVRESYVSLSIGDAILYYIQLEYASEKERKRERISENRRAFFCLRW